MNAKEIIANLLALQELEFSSDSGDHGKKKDQLRTLLPDPILGHFDRLVARGKKGVSIVRLGVCSACHIQVTTGNLVTLARGEDIQICGSCGRYLHLPEGEPLSAAPKKAVRRPRKAKVKPEVEAS